MISNNKFVLVREVRGEILEFFLQSINCRVWGNIP